MTTETAAVDLRDAPPDDFIETMRARYPIEPEMDRVLTRKMRMRRGGARPDFSLRHLVECLERMLNDKLEPPYSISNCRWLSGGASKLQVAFSLDWNDPERGRTTTEMVARMEPAESLNATSRLREFQIFNALRGTLPVPRVFWLDAEATWFPQEAIVYEFVPGVTKPSNEASRVTGIGQTFGPDIRKALAPQFVDCLARIHTFDYAKADLGAFDIPVAGTTESALFQLNRARRVWEEDRGHDMAFFHLAADWLERNLPELDTPSLLHGDYRAGNFLFDESTQKITGWLDFERGYIGDRHRDLAWTTTRNFGHYADDGKTFLVTGLVPEEQFFEWYEKASGLTVDPARLRFYRILNDYQMMVGVLATAYRLVRLGKTHQDVLIAWLEGIGYAQAEELRRTMEEEL